MAGTPPTRNARLLPTEGPDGKIGQSWWVPFGEGLEVPPHFTYDGLGPFDWTIAVQVAEDGRPQCVGITCRAADGGHISAEALRRFPLGRLVEEATLMAARPVDEIPRLARKWSTLAEARRAQAKALKRYRRVKRDPHRHAAVTDELLEKVASVYRANVPKGRPTAAVGEALGYSRSRAGSLVMEARRRGFLSPTEERKARG